MFKESESSRQSESFREEVPKKHSSELDADLLARILSEAEAYERGDVDPAVIAKVIAGSVPSAPKSRRF